MISMLLSSCQAEEPGPLRSGVKVEEDTVTKRIDGSTPRGLEDIQPSPNRFGRLKMLQFGGCTGFHTSFDLRPPLLGSMKPPNEKKRMYHYYCNKIYKAMPITIASRW